MTAFGVALSAFIFLMCCVIIAVFAAVYTHPVFVATALIVGVCLLVVRRG